MRVEMMSMTAQMMDTSLSLKMMQGLDKTAVHNLIEACSAAEQACVMCADGMIMDASEMNAEMLASGMMGAGLTGSQLARCTNLCMDAADISHALMRLLLRPSGYDLAVLLASVRACLAITLACAEECMKRADLSEQCRMCAQACHQCADSCEKLMASMKALIPLN
jgi:hypothetical protein